jgi:hypothetical protein
MRRSIEQFAANQDQSARKVEQIAQAITTLQAAGQDLSQKISTLSSQVVRVAPPKPVQPEGPVNNLGWEFCAPTRDLTSSRAAHLRRPKLLSRGYTLSASAAISRCSFA